MKRTKIAQLLASPKPLTDVTVMGWVKTVRDSKKIAFIELNDGSSVNNLQIVAKSDLNNFDDVKRVSVGSSARFVGDLVESKGAGQSYELVVKEFELFGGCNPETFPLQKKEQTNEYLRSIAHLRPRTKTFSTVFRMRHYMSYAIHKFFHDKGFYYIHTPIITASDCEGAGEMFQVTTLPLDKVPKTKEGAVDFGKDFFGKQAFLTVSGQLSVENFAMSLADVYTFGPTFRSENSNTYRHASEFWMIEPEMAFCDVHGLMDMEEEFIKYLVKFAFNECMDELKFFDETVEPGLIKRLRNVLDEKFERLTYTDAIELLQKSVVDGKVTFDKKVEWGIDLGTEHERFLTDTHFKKGVIIYDYPKTFKAFYMYLNDDDKTVRATDVLLPKVGETVGGSEREWRLDVLRKRIKEMGLDEQDYWWYLDLRRFGSVPHAGFGLGLERFLMFLTGIKNIRDVIPFARTPKNAEF